jgi:phage regulator Rha-like protein|tara:strand:- start:1830 stop:2231 length:402 start_codon:yes stop_codon:yes gene_type:complete
MNMPMALNGPTMSSLEIAELVESRHDAVKRAIERLTNRGVIVQPPLVDVPSEDAMGRSRNTQVYVFEREQGKRDSYVVVAQLSPEVTARLVDRWQELEGQVAKPAQLSRIEILQIALDSEQARIALCCRGCWI